MVHKGKVDSPKDSFLYYLTRVPTRLSMALYICILLQTGVYCLSHLYSILNFICNIADSNTVPSFNIFTCAQVVDKTFTVIRRFLPVRTCVDRPRSTGTGVHTPVRVLYLIICRHQLPVFLR